MSRYFARFWIRGFPHCCLLYTSYSDNLLMLTLGRGGPVVWLSEADAKELGIADNDWIEVFNSNGALTVSYTHLGS